MEEILSEIKKLAENNCKEITLLGQNVNSYQFTDKNSSADEANKFTFPKLLNYLAQSFPKINFKFITSHPKDFSEKLMEVIADNKNISREIHLPFQSGSNKILSAMNRPYTQKHYLALIKKAREIIPEVSFTTDVIVGFPGETQKDFEESAKVFRYVKFSEAYINKYSPRPGTAAEKLGDPISWDEKKRRERILRELL
jgi:tRNA-2-methylthio-N6-dimethylallyladenosine synthase